MQRGELHGIHFIHSDDDLHDTQGFHQQSMLFGLSCLEGCEEILRINHEDRCIGLGSTVDHVRDKIFVPGGVENGNFSGI